MEIVPMTLAEANHFVAAIPKWAWLVMGSFAIAYTISWQRFAGQLRDEIIALRTPKLDIAFDAAMIFKGEGTTTASVSVQCVSVQSARSVMVCITKAWVLEKGKGILDLRLKGTEQIAPLLNHNDVKLVPILDYSLGRMAIRSLVPTNAILEDRILTSGAKFGITISASCENATTVVKDFVCYVDRMKLHLEAVEAPKQSQQSVSYLDFV
jgi:hypothetical protein